MPGRKCSPRQLPDSPWPPVRRSTRNAQRAGVSRPAAAADSGSEARAARVARRKRGPTRAHARLQSNPHPYPRSRRVPAQAGSRRRERLEPPQLRPHPPAFANALEGETRWEGLRNRGSACLIPLPVRHRYYILALRAPALCLPQASVFRALVRTSSASPPRAFSSRAANSANASARPPGRPHAYLPAEAQADTEAQAQAPAGAAHSGDWTHSHPHSHSHDARIAPALATGCPYATQPQKIPSPPRASVSPVFCLLSSVFCLPDAVVLSSRHGHARARERTEREKARRKEGLQREGGRGRAGPSCLAVVARCARQRQSIELSPDIHQYKMRTARARAVWVAICIGCRTARRVVSAGPRRARAVCGWVGECRCYTDVLAAQLPVLAAAAITHDADTVQQREMCRTPCARSAPSTLR